MTTWYLIIILSNGGYGGASSTYVPFATEEACQTAKKQLAAAVDWAGPSQYTVCVKDR